MSCILCTVIFNDSRVTLITGHLQGTEHRKRNIKHGFITLQDMSLAEKITKFFFLGVQQTRSLAHVSQFDPLITTYVVPHVLEP